jgi:hypothetical protein
LRMILKSMLVVRVRRRMSHQWTATGRSHPHQTPQPNYY